MVAPDAPMPGKIFPTLEDVSERVSEYLLPSGSKRA